MSHLKTSEVAYQGAQDGFVARPETSQSTESMPAGPLLYGAYAAVWVVLILYIFTIATRLARVERDLKDVTTRLSKRG